jgi:anti-sigma factor RsiW
MECRDVEPLWADWLGGELSAEQTEQVEGHLNRCPACRREADSLRRTLKLVQSLDAEPPTRAAISTSTRRGMSLLRIAAVIVFSFAAGFAARELTGGASPSEPSPQQPSQPITVASAPHWQRQLAQLARQSGGQISFGQLLVALAPSQPKQSAAD